MSGSGGSSASEGRDEFGFDLAGGVDDELDDLEPGDGDLDDDDLDDLDDDEDEDDDLIDDELIDLDDEYDDADDEDKPHPGHRYDE
jgi:DNA-directed RNA polymerase subunit delta